MSPTWPETSRSSTVGARAQPLRLRRNVRERRRLLERALLERVGTAQRVAPAPPPSRRRPQPSPAPACGSASRRKAATVPAALARGPRVRRGDPPPLAHRARGPARRGPQPRPARPPHRRAVRRETTRTHLRAARREATGVSAPRGLHTGPACAAVRPGAGGRGACSTRRCRSRAAPPGRRLDGYARSRRRR